MTPVQEGFPYIHIRFPLDFFLAVCQYIDMICINCFHEKTSTTNSRKHKKHSSVWRRRTCAQCGAVFTTYETPSLDGKDIIDHTQHKQAFNIGKLTISIAKSFQHNKQAADFASFSLAQTVEERLIVEVREPSIDDITAITHTVLKAYDPMAALQYAAQHQLITTKRRPGRPSTAYAQPLRDPSSRPSPSQ
jgi:transcriptional repressor NrdR